MLSGKMCTSCATSAPSRSPTVVVPMNLPLAMSERLPLKIPTTMNLSASVTFTLCPLRSLMVRFCPSSFSMVPRILTGGLAGAWARAMAGTTATNNPAIRRIIGFSSVGGDRYSPCCKTDELVHLPRVREFRFPILLREGTRVDVGAVGAVVVVGDHEQPDEARAGAHQALVVADEVRLRLAVHHRSALQ